MMETLDSSAFVFLAGTVLAIYASHWLYRWRNPKCRNGVLPPGSMGLPLIGETIQLVLPSASLDLPPFIKTRMKKYGPIFKTNVAGRPVIVTADAEFNHFLLRQDGKLADTWSMDTFAEVFDQASQSSRKYTRNLALNHFGVEALKGTLLPQMEAMATRVLSTWATHDSVELKTQAVTMSIDFAAAQIFSGDAPSKISDMFRDLVEGLMSFPVNIPGTAHHKCLQIHKKVREMMRDVVTKRLAEAERRHGRRDLLDHIIEDKSTEAFINDDFIVQLMFGLLFVTSDSVSTTLALAFKLLADHHLVLHELTAEHEAILKKRDNSDHIGGLTWDEYKSMTFTLQVINEVLRLGNIAPGFFRRALKDIPVNGYIIPQGWVIMIATAGLHLNPNQFEDPLKFNPWRWKEIQPSVVAKCFMPFGSGMKQCAGAEYSKVLIATFLHVLVTKYRWELVKGGKIVRSPIIRFPDGFHYNISEKQNRSD
ncbi:cucurbitadienol 11-hydroxylase-like [Salvia miltiorrhiza]|uniref:cucurbitadienol 11-hydroxylase-like n=1 Tax=Salvia miltiorrhiza TaxID=226208 RepID=UPI0025AC2944|nr:cucurbitadienol 11-hydroxylase-like [Salvia miltiorrhiza]